VDRFHNPDIAIGSLKIKNWLGRDDGSDGKSDDGADSEDHQA
jgi:hypothetical protein